jgi:hypothetical protein
MPEWPLCAHRKHQEHVPDLRLDNGFGFTHTALGHIVPTESEPLLLSGCVVEFASTSGHQIATVVIVSKNLPRLPMHAGKPAQLRDLGYDEIWLQNWLAADPARLGLGEVQIVAQELSAPRGGSPRHPCPKRMIFLSSPAKVAGQTRSLT